MSAYVLTKLKEMREELDTLINLVEGSSEGKVPVTHFTQLEVGDVVELLSDYTHYLDEDHSLQKGSYVVDMVEDDFYRGSLDISFASTCLWYNFENITKQTQVLKVKV